MPSPFPGMDPYIESWIWPDFHASFVSIIHDQLNPILPRRYIASVDVLISKVDDLELVEPDFYFSGRNSTSKTSTSTISPVITTMLPGIVKKQRYIKIVDKEERRVVTVIEILSPSNKTAGDDGIAYRLKREEYLANRINLVEIDFLRGGKRPPLGDPEPSLTDYYVLVHRAWEENRFGIWPISIRDALPLIPIPLDPDVPDVKLDLRSCIDHVYDYGRYAEQLDYTKAPKPPLREPDATWARKLLASHQNPV